MYETFDHTADLGLRIRADDLPGLFADAGRALTSLLVDDITVVRETTSVTIALPTDDLEFLLFDFLKAILYHFETEHVLLVRFDVQLADSGLLAIGHGEPLDAARHPLGREVKAITYHALRVEQVAEGWLAEVIVDI